MTGLTPANCSRVQTDAAVTGKVRSLMVERTARGATSADVVEERSRRHALRCDTCQRSEAR